MIIPRPLLIFLAAVTLVPLLGLGGFWPGLLAPGAMAVVLVGAIAALDAWLGRARVAEIKVTYAVKIRAVQGRPAHLELAFETHRAEAVTLRVGLGFAPELLPADEEMHVPLPARAGRHFVGCDFTPSRRGLFFIDGCFFERPSPLRLWDVRGKEPRRVEVRAYPNLERERKQVASLFLRTNRAGQRAVRQVGQGRDFEKLREYVAGDGYDTIHWKATARRGHPITKVFQVERTQEVYVILDASRLTGRLQNPDAPEEGTRLDRYLAAALLLGLAAERQGDLFGLLTFSSEILSFVRARNGKEHYHACREALYRLEPQAVSPDYEEVASFVRLRLRRRALLVFMTDLDDPVLAQSFARAAELICHQHLVLVQMINAGGIRPVFSNPEVHDVDDIYRDLAEHMAWSELWQQTLTLQQRGVRLSLLAGEQFCAETTNAYLRVKQRQML
jgi:uncharacterized protein (DUF58 family)